MILVLHILIALASLIWTGLAFLAPTTPRLRGSYGLVALTLTSGTYLVMSTGSPLLQSCVTGLIYLGVVLAGIVATQHKLNSIKQPN